ncbi:MAG: PKD domain-containing protein, partial [Bacteroidetes bacterium]|nr:PKD domain-containing protein [Bacteroidota bacterium]
MFIHALNGIGAQYINVQSIADRRNALIVSPTPPLNFAITTWTGAYDYVADTMTCGTGIHLIHIWLPHVFKQIYRHVLARENRDSIPVYFTGFSAGAQCVTRYMLVRQFFPDSIPIKMAVSMSPAGYIFGTDIFNDSTMVFPFGLAKGSVGSEWDCKTSIYDTLDLHFLCNEHVVQYYNENYGVMVGTLDTAAYGWWPLTIEGYSRYERAKNFYNFSDTNAITRGTTLKWVYDTVPGVGHAGATLYSTTATGDSIPIVERVLFDTPWHPVPNSALAIDFSSDKNIVSLPNATVQFYNNTLNATSYLWDFGDGYGSTVVNPSHTYASVDTFTVKLTASSGSGCTYTLTKKYYIIVKSGMGVNESTMYDARCTIYPNPTSGVFNVQMSQFENLKMKDIEIYN